MNRSLILNGCTYIVNAAKGVRINDKAIQKASEIFTRSQLDHIVSEEAFDTDIHLVGRDSLTAQYLLVIDSLNFCFWPEDGLEYAELAIGLKKAVENDAGCISAEQLAHINEAKLTKLLGRRFPNISERVRLLQEVGSVLLSNYDGCAANLIRHANKSAISLVNLLSTQFRGFQDHAIYRGQQVFFYKRAQIFAGDVWGAFKGKDLGEFHDMDQLTMFADYRVPVILRELGVLEYADSLATKIDNRHALDAGSKEELEIRASTIVATERLKQEMEKQHNIRLFSVQLDWWLWEQGEKNRQSHRPHHRVDTIFY